MEVYLKKKLWNSIDEFAEAIRVSPETLYYWMRESKNSVHAESELIKGKSRNLVKPRSDYKALLKKIDCGLKTYPLPKYFFGSPKGVSQIDCARVHISSPYILKLDLKAYYPSTGHRRVQGAFSMVTGDPKLSSLLTRLCTYNYQLPQGYPTSQTIAELILIPLSKRLFALCKEYGLKLTIYIDDIVISGSKILFSKEKLILSIFQEMNFQLNFDKKELVKNKSGIDITGVHIENRRATTKSKFDESLRLHYLMCELWPHDSEIRKQLRRSLIGKKNWMKQVDEVKLRRFEHKYETQRS